MKQYKFAGREKFVAYAPIKYYASSYPKPAGFGWVGMGVDVGKYNEFASVAAKKIQSETKAWTTTIVIIIIVSVILLFLIMALLTRGIPGPLPRRFLRVRSRSYSTMTKIDPKSINEKEKAGNEPAFFWWCAVIPGNLSDAGGVQET